MIATESVAWLTPLFLSTDVNFTEASTRALCAHRRAFARFGTTTEERGGGQSTRRSRRVGRRTRIGKVWTRSASRTKVPDRAGDVSTRASALETRNARHDDTTHVLSRRAKVAPRTSSERGRANSLDAPCGYPTMSEQSRTRVRSSLASRARRFRASSKLSLAYLVVRRHVRRSTSPPHGPAVRALCSADRSSERSVLGGTPRAVLRRALSPMRDAAARVTGGGE